MTPEGKSFSRNVIKFCVQLGKNPTETLEMFGQAGEGTNVSRALVFKWHKRFRDGRGSCNDNERSGCPTSVTTESNVSHVRDKLDQDRRITLTQLSEDLSISYGSVHNIVHKKLEMSRVCARWVPRLLKDHEKIRRIEESKKFLRRYKTEGRAFLNRIITVDETWISNFDPESKQMSMQWRRSKSPPPKKARVCKSCIKHMFIIFFDSRGIILSHMVPRGISVNAKYYSKVN